jgi:hypothetical protein
MTVEPLMPILAKPAIISDSGWVCFKILTSKYMKHLLDPINDRGSFAFFNSKLFQNFFGVCVAGFCPKALSKAEKEF